MNGWDHIERVTEWLDDNNGRSDLEIAMRVMKITEEAGETVEAFLGYMNQNPRKGRSHTAEDVRMEICDVILTGMTALSCFADDPEGYFDGYITTGSDRLANLRKK